MQNGHTENLTPAEKLALRSSNPKSIATLLSLREQIDGDRDSRKGLSRSQRDGLVIEIDTALLAHLRSEGEKI